MDDRLDINELYAACDVYASLHRSEGFGLTLAEAMLHGKPVVASDWSGNLEFMTPGSAVLTPCEVTPIRDSQKTYAAHQRWADPNLDVAAAAFKSLAEDAEARLELGRRGRRLLSTRLSRLPAEIGLTVAPIAPSLDLPALACESL